MAIAEQRAVDRFLPPLLVAGMAACITVSISTLLHILVPTWNDAYLPVFCTLATLAAFYSYRLYHRYQLYIYGGMRFRLAELAVLFVILQILVDITQHRPPLREGLPRIDFETALGFIPAFFCWEAATATAHDLDHLDELPLPNSAYTSPIQRMTGRYFIGGLVLFVAAGLTQLSNESLLHLKHEIAGPVLNVVLYFFLGMLLFIHVRFRTLQLRWSGWSAVVSPEMQNRWLRYSLLLLSIAAVIAAVLPTSYTLSLLDVAQAIIDTALSIGGLLFFLLTLPFAALMSLFGSHPPPIHHTPPPAAPPHAPAGHGGLPIHWLATIRSVLFWLVTLAVVIYLLRAAMSEYRPSVAVSGPLSRIAAWMVAVWQAFFSRAKLYASAARERMRTMQRRRDMRTIGTLARMRRPRTPREHVLFLYAAALHRAAQAGLPRAQSETPDEYAESLRGLVPETDEEVEDLTDVFVHARYSSRQVDKDEEGKARSAWRRLSAALRRSRGSSPVSGGGQSAKRDR